MLTRSYPQRYQGHRTLIQMYIIRMYHRRMNIRMAIHTPILIRIRTSTNTCTVIIRLTLLRTYDRRLRSHLKALV